MNAIIAIALSSVLGQPAPVDASRLPAKVEAKVVAATVRIVNNKKNTMGNGLIIGRTGSVAYVLTAGHIVAEADEVEVRIYEPKADAKPIIRKSMKVLARRTENNQDLALLRVTDYTGDSDGLTLCPKDAVPKGKFAAFSATCRDDKNASVRAETIEKSVQVVKPGAAIPARFWSSARKTNAGESGSPLVDAKGRVLGVCSGAQGDHGYFCHIEEIHAFVRSAGLEFLLEKKP